MPPTTFETPVLFLVFNRPENTRRVFEAIRRRKPRHLFVAADGPRPGREEDVEACRSTREVIDSVDWDCEVKTLFRDANLGCRKAVQGALDWFFGQVEEGIILEDDTLPADRFFDYCAAMLERYRDDEGIFSVNGCNFGYHSPDGRAAQTAYFFMWGWASWRRSNELTRRIWEEYESRADLTLDRKVIRRLRTMSIWDDSLWLAYWQQIFESTARGVFNTWDYQWVYTALHEGRWCIRPAENLVINIGFDKNATTTHDSGIDLAMLKHGPEVPGELGEVIQKRDRIYENEFMAPIWRRYNVKANSRLYRFYLAIRRTLRQRA